MTVTSSPTASTNAGSSELRPIDLLRPNPLNPRGELDPAGLDELADSMRAQGVLQPLLVTPGGLVLGMEGAEEHALPPGATRHPYKLGGAKRAIIEFRSEYRE